MMLQKPVDEPTGFEMDKLCRASFFPRAKLPGELLDKIEFSLRFQRQLFIPDRILKGRPMTTSKAKSRFNGHSAKVRESLTTTNFRKSQGGTQMLGGLSPTTIPLQVNLGTALGFTNQT